MPKGNPSKIVLRSTRDISEKKFACDACERKFFTKKDAKRHMVVHTGKRDFVCARCPQRFGRKDHLVRHFKKSHNSSLRKIAGLASLVSEDDLTAASLISTTADGTTNKSPHRNTNMPLKQETGNYTACQHATEFGHRIESPTQLVGLSNAVIKEEHGTELASDCHDLSALAAPSVDALEPASEASGMSLDDTQLLAMSLLDPAHQLAMDPSAYRSIFENVNEEAVYNLRIVQLHNMLAVQSGVIATPAQSPISNIQAKRIRQSGGFVIETADQIGSRGVLTECEIDALKRQETGEFGPDIGYSGSILSNPSSPEKTELCWKQEVFFTDLTEEVDPEDYVNSLTPPHSETAHSGQVSPHEIEANNGCFQPPAFGANKEQQLLEARVLELLNNNPLRIPTDVPSLLSYLCDLAAESIAMGDSQSPSQSDNSSSQGDCWDRSRLPFFPDDKEVADLNQLLEQVCEADQCIVPEHAAATAKNLHLDNFGNLAGEKQAPSLNDFEPDLLLLGHDTSVLSAAREDQASEAWFCGRGDLLEEKHFRGCGMEPNELEQMPAWLCQA